VRSKKPAGKAKGKSFGAREDKMNEHMRQVHNKDKRKRGFGEDDGEHEDEGEGKLVERDDGQVHDVGARPAKRTRGAGVHEDAKVRASRRGY
jgi:hypothetical protein